MVTEWLAYWHGVQAYQGSHLAHGHKEINERERGGGEVGRNEEREKGSE